MQYIYEAVITPHGEGFQASFPGWDGLTAEGEDFADVARNATAALQQAANDALEKRQALPECAFDAEVPEGGRSIIISIDALALILADQDIHHVEIFFNDLISQIDILRLCIDCKPYT